MATKKNARKGKPAAKAAKPAQGAKAKPAPVPAKPKPKQHLTITKAKGRPMLSWVGKRALRTVTAFPAQHVESFAPDGTGEMCVVDPKIWMDWPEKYPKGGLLFHGDNKEVLAHLLGSGFRGQVNLVYIDPPFDSGADYVRKVILRGAEGTAKMEGEAYTLGEQIQYTDIWANDNYLQFMYERLILIKELLAPNGSVWLHCDWHKSHHLRCLMDEVFGSDSLRNEVIWQRTDPHNDALSRLGWIHDSIFWYGKGDDTVYNWRDVVEELSEAALKEYSLIKMLDGDIASYSPDLADKGRRFKLDDCTYKGTDQSRRFPWRGARPSDKRVWPYDVDGMDEAVSRGEFYLRNPEKGAARCRVSYLDERPGQVLQTIWTECGRMKGGVDYPTEKPQALLARIIQASSNPGDVVLDCFVGSGTTAAAAQSLGRRWIVADINKGAIQDTAIRLQRVIGHQIRAAKKAMANGVQSTLPGIDEQDQPPAPVQLGFNVWRVNDYDLAIQHNEAVNLACEHIGVTRTLADAFFEGTVGKKLVKIVPFGHALSPADLEDIKRELDLRANETRDVLVVCLGSEVGIAAWLADWNRMRRQGDTPNKIEVIELRSDPKYGRFIVHKPAQARVSISRRTARDGDTIVVEVKDFISPSITERLQSQADLLSPKITDWQAMVDSVMIDPAHDGKVFNIALADIPGAKQDYVKGTYELPGPSDQTTVAVKITDMLGEEVIITKVV